MPAVRFAAGLTYPANCCQGETLEMKLFVQIPCYNEAETLPLVLDSIPRLIPGIEEVKVLIIDDGSTDDTVRVARQHGVDYIVRHADNKGLARAFRTGLDACVRLGASVIVNTDGDNQYPQQDIPRLIAPVLSGKKLMGFVREVFDIAVREVAPPPKPTLEQLTSLAGSLDGTTKPQTEATA